ncbi:2-phosphosulfolactate phosphatase [Pontibacillus yanchengensis]|uniref:Probable 2-phosphosulfolactate phosphatase n=1 Tax=Pontibacillus yanchengensis TaxID=462910 RepID=A0A6I4ZWC7_9BACI|nr:2-phosphosulfolactate phosphatase [Pontibacillus yanchengensis]MYL32627.1 2-phosphosulfolactate phosphatase [Pontibacillus yanchengensis]
MLLSRLRGSSVSKIQVVFKKEDIEPTKWTNHSVAVIFDVLLATSTITSVLANGAKDVLPVVNEAEAKRKAADQVDATYLLSGEYNGVTIRDFHHPNPLWLKKHVYNRRLILSTTNGTVAIKKSEQASSIYMASLLNVQAVAEWLTKKHSHHTITLVCAGSGGSFCLEDFYGAGALVSKLVGKGSWELSDSAKAALLFYEQYIDSAFSLFQQSKVGEMLLNYGLEKDLHYVARENVYETVPLYSSREGLIKEVNSYASSGQED